VAASSSGDAARGISAWYLRAMVDAARKRVSYAEYVAIANDSPVKYEYIAGEIVGMSGGIIQR
jgi:hypothetical protein